MRTCAWCLPLYAQARAASNRKSEADPAEPREGKTRRSGRGAAKAAEEEANTLQRLQSKQAPDLARPRPTSPDLA